MPTNRQIVAHTAWGILAGCVGGVALAWTKGFPTPDFASHVARSAVDVFTAMLLTWPVVIFTAQTQNKAHRRLAWMAWLFVAILHRAVFIRLGANPGEEASGTSVINTCIALSFCTGLMKGQPLWGRNKLDRPVV